MDKHHYPSERLRDQRTSTDSDGGQAGEVLEKGGVRHPGSELMMGALSPDVWEDTGFVRKDGAALRVCMWKSKMVRKAEGTRGGFSGGRWWSC